MPLQDPLPAHNRRATRFKGPLGSVAQCRNSKKKVCFRPSQYQFNLEDATPKEPHQHTWNPFPGLYYTSHLAASLATHTMLSVVQTSPRIIQPKHYARFSPVCSWEPSQSACFVKIVRTSSVGSATSIPLRYLHAHWCFEACFSDQSTDLFPGTE